MHARRLRRLIVLTVPTSLSYLFNNYRAIEESFASERNPDASLNMIYECRYIIIVPHDSRVGVKARSHVRIRDTFSIKKNYPPVIYSS